MGRQEDAPGQISSLGIRCPDTQSMITPTGHHTFLRRVFHRRSPTSSPNVSLVRRSTPPTPRTPIHLLPVPPLPLPLQGASPHTALLELGSPLLARGERSQK
jgi:hypothetical protein